MDVKDFYLNTPMKRFEYMRLKLADMPDDIIEQYQLQKLATPDGFIYCEIQKGMYGLPQAGIIAQELLEERLAKHGYRQSKTMRGLWTHDTCPICFSLVVDNFGVKYVGEEHAQHLLSVMQKYYKCSCDWEGEQYCGLTLKWDYEGKKVHLTMPNYVSKALTRFQHPPSSNHRTNHTHMSSPTTEPKNNSPNPTTIPPSTRQERILSKKSAAYSNSSPAASTATFSPHSARSHPNRLTRRNERWRSASNPLITWRHRTTRY